MSKKKALAELEPHIKAEDDELEAGFKFGIKTEESGEIETEVKPPKRRVRSRKTKQAVKVEEDTEEGRDSLDNFMAEFLAPIKEESDHV